MENVIIFSGQKCYEIEFDGLKRCLPVVEVDDGVWIASNASLVLGDVEFISKAAELLCARIVSFGPEVLVTAEAKSIALAFEVARRLGLKRYVIARKNPKAYMGKYIIESVKSITTKEKQSLILTEEDVINISGKRVCVLDDVISTGGTIDALVKLVEKAGGKIVCKAAVWREGPWYNAKEIVYLRDLPIFVDTLDRIRI
ncbi:MAG: phosphoribosyltransferase family protein [Nitrososphaeria archaeon]|nr:phosphoribosyltransferase family protein [Nitrososphaeria archaeon]